MQAEATGKLWFLPFKVNNKGVHIVFSSKYLGRLIPPGNYLVYKNYIVTGLDNFFEKNKEFLLTFSRENLQLKNDSRTVTTQTETKLS